MDDKSPNQDAAKVWKMLESIDTCMFVTLPGGVPNGRPMSSIPKQEEGVIYILTESTAAAARDLEQDSKVLLSYQSSQDHVAVTGTAVVDPDKALVKRLWNPGAETFWPDGPETPNVVALRITPDRADYWDGPNPVVAAFKFVSGLLRQTPPDMGDRGAVDL